MKKGYLYDGMIAFVKAKFTYLSLTVYILVVLVLFYFFINKSPLNLIKHKKETPIIAYNDSVDGGNSKVRQLEVTDTVVSLTYQLEKGFISPYIGLIFGAAGKYYDVSSYNRLHFEIEAKKANNVFVYLITKDKNVRDSSQRLSQRHSGINLVFEKNVTHYDVNLSEFITPGWWYESVNQSSSDFSTIELDKLVAVSITTGLSPIIGKQQELRVKSMYFYKDNFYFYLSVVVGCVLICLVLFISQVIEINKKLKKTVEILYKPTQIDKVVNLEEIFLSFIHAHYNEANLTLGIVAKESGVSERVISKAISDQFGCNFKSYINQIRIEEAKRLLKNSEMNISQIAYTVGFNSPSSFNKVFKKITGNTPSSVS